jgi:hypothetical protein
LDGINYQISGSFTLFIVIVTYTNSENSVINRSVLSSLTKGRGTIISALIIHAILNQRNSKIADKICASHHTRERENSQKKETACQKDTL